MTAIEFAMVRCAHEVLQAQERLPLIPLDRFDEAVLGFTLPTLRRVEEQEARS
jgi:hypothetical protein